MSPTQQLDIMHRQEENANAMEVEPTERDLKASIGEISNGLAVCCLELFNCIFFLICYHTEVFALHQHWHPHRCDTHHARQTANEHQEPVAVLR